CRGDREDVDPGFVGARGEAACRDVCGGDRAYADWQGRAQLGHAVDEVEGGQDGPTLAESDRSRGCGGGGGDLGGQGEGVAVGRGSGRREDEGGGAVHQHLVRGGGAVGPCVGAGVGGDDAVGAGSEPGDGERERAVGSGGAGGHRSAIVDDVGDG